MVSMASVTAVSLFPVSNCIHSQEATPTQPNPSSGKKKETEKEWVSCDHAAKHYNLEKDPSLKKLLDAEAGIKCKCTKHFALMDYAQYGPDNFREAYAAGRKNYPSCCLACCLIFTTLTMDPSEASQYYKVDAKNVVYGCRDAFVEDRECIKALCTPCHSKYAAELNPSRSRKRATTLMPGEKQDGSGNIVSV